MTRVPSPQVCAVVVAYQPDMDKLVALLDGVRSQVAHTVLVINGSLEPLQHDQLRPLEQNEDVDCVFNFDNKGLGAAQNQGIEKARQRGCEMILLLDQDSCPAPDMVARLCAVWRSREAAGDRPAAVAPRYESKTDGGGHWPGFVRMHVWGFGRVGCPKDSASVEADFLIASGSLIALSVLDDVGEMDAGLFIDHIDTEWCLRAQARGYRLFGVCEAVMAHELGEQRLSFWLGRRRQVAVHQPQRYYYMFRNSMLLYRRQHMPLLWKWGDALRSMQLLVFFTLFSPQRLAILAMMLRGWRDGVLGRTGAYAGP